MGKQQYARCYLQFRDPAALRRFAAAFQGHAFRNAAGEEHRALVDLAPLQAPVAPPAGGRAAAQSLAGTLAADPEFQAFCAAQAAPAPPPPSVEAMLEARAAAAAPPDPAETPLLKFFRDQRAGLLAGAGDDDGDDDDGGGKTRRGKRGGKKDAADTVRAPPGVAGEILSARSPNL
jgi:hypothetical protein